MAALVRIYVAAYRAAPYNATWDSATAERIIREMKQRFPEECFVAELEGEVVGFILCASLAGLRAFVEEFAVAPEHQGQGIGDALLRHVIEHYRQRDYPLLELIANWQAPAWDFYLRRGLHESQDYRLMALRL